MQKDYLRALHVSLHMHLLGFVVLLWSTLKAVAADAGPIKVQTTLPMNFQDSFS